MGWHVAERAGRPRTLQAREAPEAVETPRPRARRLRVAGAACSSAIVLALAGAGAFASPVARAALIDPVAEATFASTVAKATPADTVPNATPAGRVADVVPARTSADTQSASGSSTNAAETVRALDVDVEAAFQRADVAYLRDILADDFQFWISTGKPLDKTQVLSSYNQPGRFPLRKASSIDVELHGDVALVNGRLEVRSTVPREYIVCYLRLYQQRNAKWVLVSHRTFRERDGAAETCRPVDR